MSTMLSNALNNPDLDCKWKRFIHEGIHPLGMRKEIVNSWKRSRSRGIDPYEMPPVLNRLLQLIYWIGTLCY
ncbi:hypothetical protein [Neobacillus mesonae]|uniref:hypothetical protein n=1 Tax=Neobacillus mesonae TaxID=1193713 RepID=UPI00203B1825|nr:hypothetical protein [Neobacillus mesonae]MCM3568094.1 hypothetical protein [Neobacillus mesonae]